MLEKLKQFLLNLIRRPAKIRPDDRGLIIVEPTETDYVAGKFTAITYNPILPSGDWRPYLPEEENQYLSYREAGKFVGLDTMACVSFSANNVIETILNFHLVNKNIPEETLAFFQANGYIVNGKFNCSDRYLAKLSGTTPQGNNLAKVADTLRHFGIVPEAIWPWDIRQVGTWEQYYAPVPQRVIDLGMKSIEYLDILYEWVFADLAQALKAGPLQITIPTTCPGYESAGTVASCPAGPNHAVTYAAGQYNIFDHYPPFQKNLAPNYNVPWKMKFVINFKKKMENEIILSMNYKGKLGLLFLGGLSGGLVFARDWSHWLEICNRYGKNSGLPANISVGGSANLDKTAFDIWIS